MHQPVREEFPQYMVINLHRGLFKFTGMPGYTGSASNLQKSIDTVLGDVPEVIAYQDDILISSSTKEQNLERLETFLQKLDEHNFRLHMDKCKFLQVK